MDWCSLKDCRRLEARCSGGAMYAGSGRTNKGRAEPEREPGDSQLEAPHTSKSSLSYLTPGPFYACLPPVIIATTPSSLNLGLDLIVADSALACHWFRDPCQLPFFSFGEAAKFLKTIQADTRPLSYTAILSVCVFPTANCSKLSTCNTTISDHPLQPLSALGDVCSHGQKKTARTQHQHHKSPQP